METRPSELMAFNAVEEPGVMQARSDVMSKQVKTARSGELEPGTT